MALGSVVIFTILILPIQEHGVSLHLCHLWFLSSVSYSFLHTSLLSLYVCLFHGGSDGKASACNVENPGSIPGLGRSPGEGNGNPFQYSCLENPMDGGAS